MPDRQASIPAPDDWPALIERAGLRGAVGALARNATLLGMEGGVLRLAVRDVHAHLADDRMLGQLGQQLGAAMGKPVKVRLETTREEVVTPADLADRAARERQQEAERAVAADPAVRSLIDTFDARVIPGSVRPAD